jgi:hypothetical protein
MSRSYSSLEVCFTCLSRNSDENRSFPDTIVHKFQYAIHHVMLSSITHSTVTSIRDMVHVSHASMLVSLCPLFVCFPTAGFRSQHNALHMLHNNEVCDEFLIAIDPSCATFVCKLILGRRGTVIATLLTSCLENPDRFGGVAHCSLVSSPTGNVLPQSVISLYIDVIITVAI